MADKGYKLEIMTPFKTAFKGEVADVIAYGADGFFGVLVDHAAMLSALAFGPLYVRETGGAERWFVVSDGFFEIRQNQATLLVDTAEPKENIDVSRAQAARDRALKRIAEHKEGTDIARATAALHRALTRINTAQR